VAAGTHRLIHRHHCLVLPEGELNVTTEDFGVGDIFVFTQDLVHAGAAYDFRHVCFHIYLRKAMGFSPIRTGLVELAVPEDPAEGGSGTGGGAASRASVTGRGVSEFGEGRGRWRTSPAFWTPPPDRTRTEDRRLQGCLTDTVLPRLLNRREALAYHRSRDLPLGVSGVGVDQSWGLGLVMLDARAETFQSSVSLVEAVRQVWHFACCCAHAGESDVVRRELSALEHVFEDDLRTPAVDVRS